MRRLTPSSASFGEAGGPALKDARTLADLVPLWLAAPMQYEPGEKWKYTQSGINAAARIVEVVRDGRNGFIVPSRDVAALAARLTTLLEDNGYETVSAGNGAEASINCAIAVRAASTAPARPAPVGRSHFTR